MKVHNVIEKFEAYLPEGFTFWDEAARTANFACPKSWFVVGTAASFRKVAYQAINHWMPAWHKAQLGESRWDLCHAFREARFAEQRAGITLQIMRVQEGLAEDDDDDEDGDMLLSSLLDELKRLETAQTFFDEMKKLDLYVEDVEAKGNCGILAIDALQRGLPRCLQEDQQNLPTGERIAQMRQEARLNMYEYDCLCMFMYEYV